MEPDVTPEAALYRFMSGFGIDAYASTSVPDGAAYPYITYDLVEGDMLSGEVNVTTKVWYRTESEAEPNAKVRQMYNRIGLGGVMVPCSGGALWVKRGTPWAQVAPVDDSDRMVKCRYINIDIEYLIEG